MPWKETTTMEQKIEFICEWRTGKYTITELCKSFEISRPTAYRLIDRFEKQGYEGLREQWTYKKNETLLHISISNYDLFLWRQPIS